MDRLSDLIRGRARAEGIPLHRLCSKMGVSPGTFATLLRGDPVRSRKTLIRLMQYGIKVPADALFVGPEAAANDN